MLKNHSYTSVIVVGINMYHGVASLFHRNHGFPIEMKLTGVDFVEQTKASEEGCLAATAWPDDGDGFTIFDFQIDAL